MTIIYALIAIMFLCGAWIFFIGKKMDKDTEGPFNATAFLAMYYGILFMFFTVVMAVYLAVTT